MNSVKYVGMDVHKSIAVIAVLNELGQFESRSQVKSISLFFHGMLDLSCEVVAPNAPLRGYSHSHVC
jgi:hypothetical protein